MWKEYPRYDDQYDVEVSGVQIQIHRNIMTPVMYYLIHIFSCLSYLNLLRPITDQPFALHLLIYPSSLAGQHFKMPCMREDGVLSGGDESCRPALAQELVSP